MKKLAIAEKPSLARSIVSALSYVGECFSQKDHGDEKKAYYESENFVVTSVFGHILELKLFEDYPENKGKDMWQVNSLPFFPTHYEYKVKEDAEDRYITIRDLLERDDIDEVIHCGDPDREGQALVDIVLQRLCCNKKVTRPLLKTLTDEAIVKAFKNRESNDEFVNWRKEGLLRSYIDYDYGFNLSRYATQKTRANPALNVGRVIGAIVTEVYDREMAIRNFTPVDFYKAAFESDALKLISKKKFSMEEKDEAEDYVSSLNNQTVLVSSVKKKRVEKVAPKLFSQTALQAVMNKRYGKHPDETLKLSQSLYEKGITSYPRTNTEYLTTGDKEKVKDVRAALDDSALTFKDKKRIFDDSKIEGHSAIIPTGKTPHDLTVDETLPL